MARAAKRATSADMSLASHRQGRCLQPGTPCDANEAGKHAWLRCVGCRHSIMIEPHELAQQHGLEMQTLLLTISKAMRCTRCGARKACCWQKWCGHDRHG
jgi:hypothetical protein